MFRFENNIPAGKAKRAILAVAVRENVREPLKLGLISGYVMAAVRFWAATIFCLFLPSSCSLPHKSSFFGLERSGSGNGSCSGWVEYEDLRPKTHK